MTYLILIPPDDELAKYACLPEQIEAVVNFHMNLPERGMMAHDIYGIGEGNCFCDDLPMNQYIPGMAGLVIVDNDGRGFTDEEADQFIARLQAMRMSPEEAETHRPPNMENVFIDNTAHIYVLGTSTEQGMKSVHGFIKQIQAVVDTVPGKTLEVHYVAKDFQVPK